MSEQQQDAWELLESRYPKIAASISDSIDALFDYANLDAKTTQLVYIAAQTAANYPLAVKYHVPEALKAGATVDEIVGAAAIAAAATGPKGFVRCFEAIIETIDQLEADSS